MNLIKKIHCSIGGESKKTIGPHSIDSQTCCGTSSIFKNSSVRANIVEFSIDLDELHRVWKPNEIVKGTLMLRLKKDIPPVHILLSLHGECQLKSNSPIKTTSLRPRHSLPLFEKSRNIYGSPEQQLALTKGEHKFPFSFKIPTNDVYTSITFEKGCIKYWVQGAVVAARDPLLICKRRFQLLVPVNVGNLPKPAVKTVVLQSPASTTNHMRRFRAVGSIEQDSFASVPTGKTPDSITNASSDSNLSCVSNSSDNKTVKISVEIPSLGYVIGEELRVKIKVSHYKQYSHPAGLIATLVRICRVSNQGYTEQVETFRKDICQAVAPIYTDHDTHQADVILKLKVPFDTFPSLSLPNKLFTFQYYIEVLANLSKKNYVYTESNRLVGGTGINDIRIHSEKLNLFPRLMRDSGYYSTQGEDDDENACIMFFQDLINVDKLKRLRNVTGMSIETVIGTHRDPTISNSSNVDILSHERVPDERSPQEDGDGFSVVDEVYAVLEHENHSELEAHAIQSELQYSLSVPVQHVYPEDPVPSYTPAATNVDGLQQILPADDKNELEQIRLKQLESEPPL